MFFCFSFWNSHFLFFCLCTCCLRFKSKPSSSRGLESCNSLACSFLVTFVSGHSFRTQEISPKCMHVLVPWLHVIGTTYCTLQTPVLGSIMVCTVADSACQFHGESVLRLFVNCFVIMKKTSMAKLWTLVQHLDWQVLPKLGPLLVIFHS